MFQKFSSRHQLMLLCSNFVKFDRQEIGEIVCCLPDKKTTFRLALQLSLLRRSRPNCARTSPRQCTQERSRFHPNRFTFSRVI